jgi:hypothetical protein
VKKRIDRKGDWRGRVLGEGGFYRRERVRAEKECGAFYQYLSRSVQQCMHARINVRPFQGRS